MTAGSSGLMVGVSGIRGLVGEALTPETACRLGACFASQVPAGPVVIGRDSRPSGEVLLRAVAVGLAGAGRDVVDVGICPTPTVQIAVREMRAAGAVVVTGSHNPEEWNALKFVGGDGTFLDASRTERLWGAFTSPETWTAAWDSMGRLRRRKGVGETHLRAILSCPLIALERVRARSYKVVIDCNNGAASGLGPGLLRRLGCRVVRLHCRGDGRFAHPPEPIPENLEELCEVVREMGADVGMAVDPDADRLSLVDETGRALGEEVTLPLAALHVLSQRRGPAVVNYSTSSMTREVCKRFGVEAMKAPVGEVNVVAKMRKVDAVIGGEGNGGVILPEVQYARDALSAMCLVLSLLADRGQRLSVLRGELLQLVMLKKAVSFPRELWPALNQELDGVFVGGEWRTEDGVHVEWEHQWIHVRMSRTEPVVRVIAEAPTRDAVQHLVEQVLRAARRLSDGR
jgi:phosphomannomutase